MTDQPNPYETSETGTGVPIGEAKTPLGQRGALFWTTVGCLGAFALMGLATIGLLAWVYFNLRNIGVTC